MKQIFITENVSFSLDGINVITFNEDEIVAATPAILEAIGEAGYEEINVEDTENDPDMDLVE